MANDICRRVGTRIRDFRRERGWTQQMLADHVQLAREHICRIEAGQKEVGIRTLERLAVALSVRVRDLIEP